MWFQNKRSKERRLRQICNRYNSDKDNEASAGILEMSHQQQKSQEMFQNQRELYYQQDSNIDVTDSYDYLSGKYHLVIYSHY